MMEEQLNFDLEPDNNGEYIFTGLTLDWLDKHNYSPNWVIIQPGVLLLDGEESSIPVWRMKLEKFSVFPLKNCEIQLQKTFSHFPATTPLHGKQKREISLCRCGGELGEQVGEWKMEKMENGEFHRTLI